MAGLGPPAIGSQAVYRRVFHDVDYWRPYVLEICRRHKLGRWPTVRETRPGTFPTFLVDDRYVVKLFGELFTGAWGHRVERAMYDLLPSDPAIPAPALVADGELFTGEAWRWPYLVTTMMPGRALCDDLPLPGDASRGDVAAFLADVLRRIHALRPPPDGALDPEWTAFNAFLAKQREGVVRRQRRWGTLPAYLIAEIDDWLPSLDELVDQGCPPRLLHGDLHSAHVFGSRKGDRWRGTGIIDFTDARTGDRAYELVALHLGTFGGDRRWLGKFLDGYGFDEGLRRDFARRQMAMTLLHEFNVLNDVIPIYPDIVHADSLDDLTTMLWDVEG